MNNNDCGCMGGNYTFGESYGNMHNDCGCNKYSGEYGYDNYGYGNGGYGESYGGNDCGCDKNVRKCAFVRDDNRYEKDDCECGHKCHKEHDCGCGRKECDCECGSVSFRFCIPPFPFRCR